MLDYYALLSVPKGASADDIKRSYKTLIKKWHPDISFNNSIMSELMTRQLNEAYEILSDEIKRREYDLSLVKIREQEVKRYQQNNEIKNSNNAPFKRTVTMEPENEELVKRNKQEKVEREKVLNWMNELSRYMANHHWASKAFDNLPEKLRLHALAGMSTMNDAFNIYCQIQKCKVDMGLNTSYFNKKIIDNLLESSISSDSIDINFQILSREEVILQIFLKTSVGLINKRNVTDSEMETVKKFLKFHDFLVKKPDNFFIGVNRFTINKTDWDIAMDLIRRGV
jgi:curved DNA-binding protein CbpA